MTDERTASVVARVAAAIRDADTHDCEQGERIDYEAMARAAIAAMAE